MTDILGKIKSVLPVGKSFAKVILYLLYHNPLLVKLFGIRRKRFLHPCKAKNNVVQYFVNIFVMSNLLFVLDICIVTMEMTYGQVMRCMGMTLVSCNPDKYET